MAFFSASAFLAMHARQSGLPSYPSIEKSGVSVMVYLVCTAPRLLAATSSPQFDAVSCCSAAHAATSASSRQMMRRAIVAEDSARSRALLANQIYQEK